MTELYIYKEESSDTLEFKHMCNPFVFGKTKKPIIVVDPIVKPIIWAQDGRYGFISKEQVQNMIRRKMDLAKQQKGYAKDKPLELAFHWEDTLQLDPVTVKLMREASPQE